MVSFNCFLGEISEASPSDEMPTRPESDPMGDILPTLNHVRWCDKHNANKVRAEVRPRLLTFLTTTPQPLGNIQKLSVTADNEKMTLVAKANLPSPPLSFPLLSSQTLSALPPLFSFYLPFQPEPCPRPTDKELTSGNNLNSPPPHCTYPPQSA
ncbi:hypothetical protein Vretifemale_13780, partial [Volvox reticuliferus]